MAQNAYEKACDEPDPDFNIGQYCASTLPNYELFGLKYVIHQKEQRILHAQVSPCQFTGPDGQACSKEATFQYANNLDYKKYCSEHKLEGMVEPSLCAVSSQPNAVQTEDSDGEMETSSSVDIKCIHEACTLPAMFNYAQQDWVSYF